jgi:hypothetical protein
MTRPNLTALLTAATLVGQAQPYGNEWIDWNNTNPYLKVFVTSEGLYRVDRDNFSLGLIGSGQGIGNVNPQQLQVFHMGEEQYIYFHDLGNPASFDQGEYLEFYGKPNDGGFDTDLYEDPAHQANPYYNIASDSAAYFITWNPQATPRRLTTTINDISNPPAQEMWYMHRYRIEWHSGYWPGEVQLVSGEYLNDSRYDNAEGYGGQAAKPGIPVTQGLNLLNMALSAPVSTAAFQVRTIAVYPQDHHQKIEVNGIEVVNHNFTKEQTNLYSFDMPLTQLVNGVNDIKLSSLGTSNDHNVMTAVDVLYPHTWDFAQNAMQWFSLQDSQGNDKYIEISNFFHQNQSAIIYDMTNHTRMSVAVSSGLLKARIPMGGADSLALFISSQGTGAITTALPKLVQFTNFFNTANQGDYFIVTHPYLTQLHDGKNWVDEYRKLRDNTFPNPGSFQARTVLISQIYDQFGYGIPFHPKGLRNFIRFGYEQFADTLKHVFIVGKGYNTVALRAYPNLVPTNYVATFGYGGGPGAIAYTSADNLFPCEGHNLYPLCALGRLAATSPDQVRIYYEKMVAQEEEQELSYSIANKDWMKRVLHLGGGSTSSQQTSFKNILSKYESIVEDTCFGGNVASFFKTNPDPVEIPGYFNALIDSGVALITFFGHSSPGLLEFSLNDPADYHNMGRMPVIIANGCLSGIICGTAPGISEEYVLQEGSGAIAFIATSGLGLSSALDNVCTELYNQFSSIHYKDDLGRQLMHTYRAKSGTGNAEVQKLLGQQSLHGDPAYSMWHAQPDYALDESAVSFVPEEISTDIGFFDVKVAVKNIGKAVNGEFNVRVQRKLASGALDVDVISMTAPYYQDTVVFTFPVDVVTSVGLNEFTITVDVDPDSIDEIIDAGDFMDNNTLTVTRFISSSAAFPIFPYNYSIVGNEQLRLSASTIDPFAPVKTYTIQIDTTKLFNSGLLRSTEVTQGGGVVSWVQPPVSLIDSTVYYWRITADTSWHSSSFLYLPGTDAGWNQSHYFQFTENGYQVLELNSNRRFEFSEDFTDIYVYWGYYPNAIPDYQAMAFYINGAVHHKAGCANGVILAVFDPKTGLPWKATDPQYSWIINSCDPFSSFNREHAFNISTTSSAGRQHLKDVLDSIPTDMFILVLSYQHPLYSAWDSDSLFEKFYELGADSSLFAGIDTLPYPVPFAFFTQKGNISKSKTYVGDTITSVISEHFYVDGVWDRGYMYSSEIGPAFNWYDLKFDWHTLDSVAVDNLHLDVYGKDNSGQQTTQPILSNITGDTSLAQVDPNQYPYMHVHVYCEDTAFRTPPQLDFWRVLYQPSPDAAVNPQLAFHFKDSVLAQGDVLEFEVGIENVTEYDMDSLLVQYSLYNSTTKSTDTILTVRYDSLRAGQHLITSHSFNTLAYPGFNILTMEANPGHDQPERHHFNNFAQVAFTVDTDLENPLLDITFDGYHIMDGDIVSAKPEILIRLKDENMFIAMNDSSLFEIYLKHPGGAEQKMVPDGQTVIFIPADESNLSENNTAQVLMYPEFLIDGYYQLIVKGHDKSGNESADLEYVVNFRIINEPMISNVLNYPNPFTTATRFVFTLTGSEIPDFMKIQIMTVTGRVIREITGPELGNLHIGTNISEYAWDGRDEFGDPLGNGVYLYRVVAYLNGKLLTHFTDTNSGLQEIDNRYFTQGFGKMYLAR